MMSRHYTAQEIRRLPHAWKGQTAPDAPTLVLRCRLCQAFARLMPSGHYKYAEGVMPCEQRKRARR